MQPVGLVTHSACLEHNPGAGHPERPARLRAVLDRLEESGLTSELDSWSPPPATHGDLITAHTLAHVERVRRACDNAPGAIDEDTLVSPGSWDAALLAAGSALAAAQRVRDGAWSSAFCAVRPPGHHAERERAMGFCLFNSVAVAAHGILQQGLQRVAILDWDVHHGNGTQDIFEADPRVFYASLHQAPLYPGTGAAEERGQGEGEGTTLNVPLPAGSGDQAWRGALEDRVLPALEAFKPEMLFISAGFDAHAQDPLAGCEVSTAGFRSLTSSALELARRVAGGRVVSILEGGYNLEALADSAEAHVEALLGAPLGATSPCD
ncbi:MAG: acetoin utilization deacetylase AcuC-like enzyme [Planctomycetota bacterium]|jgi:acetoin utilization deacetylase AcuC-like enzyme